VVEGVYSSLIYLIHNNNFCKCHNASPSSTKIRGKKERNSPYTHIAILNKNIIFSFIKSENRMAEPVLSVWYVPVGEGRMWGQGTGSEYGPIVCTYVCKWKNDTCYNYSRNRGRRDKGKWWRR
jgi:hypothetical protein